MSREHNPEDGLSRRRRPRTAAATLSDVAGKAGVSIATASRVLSHANYGVADDLRARVEAAARSLRYVPNAHAQALARATSSTVGVIVHDVSDPYFSEIVRGILEVATQRDHLVMICHTGRDPERELEYLGLLRAQGIQAVILAASGRDDPAFAERMAQVVAPYTAAGGRVAMIGRHRLAADAVLPDNRGGAAALGRAVLEHGHRAIGVVSGPPSLTVTRDRLAGFAGALAEAGVALPGERIAVNDFSRDGGAAGMRELLARAPELTAVFAFSDVMAMGALAALREAGRVVPDDVSLVGYDDIPLACDLQPALATVRVPMAELGARALELALDTTGDERTVQLPVELVLRPSLGPAPAR
jgi:LacI family transcriptional regulator